ncbi:MAG: hypothetical protein GXP55_13100 [Deltaproteobacteria bacterium]|nr:hypothetical protein [Deltaproteobacteria bacterium]
MQSNPLTPAGASRVRRSKRTAAAGLRLSIAAATLGLALWSLTPSVAAASPNDDTNIFFAGLDLSTARSRPGVLIDPAFVLGYASPYVDVQLGLGGSSANLLGGSRSAFNLVPAAGYHLGWSWKGRSILQFFSLARLPIQWRSGANLARSNAVAVSGEVGIRFWRCSLGTSEVRLRNLCIGMGLSARYQQNLADFQVGSAVLPRGSAVFSVPFTFTFAINPHVE